MKALDIFIFTCISFISVALLEIGVAYFAPQSNRIYNGCAFKMRKSKVVEKVQSKENFKGIDKDNNEKSKNNEDESNMSDDNDSIPRLHLISRFIFPGSFLIFLAGYWIYYTT